MIETGEPVIKGSAYVETAAHPGEWRHYRHDYFANTLEDGTRVGVNCVVQDVTERFQSASNLREVQQELSEERVQTLVEAKSRQELERLQAASLNIMEDLDRQRKAVLAREQELKQAQAQLVQNGKLVIEQLFSRQGDQAFGSRIGMWSQPAPFSGGKDNCVHELHLSKKLVE